jgi:hypothetical protein
MNRAAVVAILLVAGAVACAPPPPPPPPPTIALYWQFVGSQGQVYGNGTQRDPGCVAANVNAIRMMVTDPTGYVVDDYVYPCVYEGVPGIYYDGIYDSYGYYVGPLLTGVYRWGIEGIRNYDFTVRPGPTNGLTVFYEQGDTNVQGDVVLTVPLAADFPDMNVSYTLQPGSVTCANNQSGLPLGQIEFSLLDTMPPYLEVYSATNLYVTCQDPPNSFPVPSVPPGNYYMRFISALTAVVPPAAAYQECGVPVTHANLVDTAPFYLTPATGTCP